MTKRWQIHQSFMNTLWRCELQTMYRHLLGIRRPPRAFIHVGTGIHESVRVDLESKIDTGELLKRQDAIDIGVAKYDERLSHDPIELEPDEKAENKSVKQIEGENRDKVANLSGLHRDKVAPNLKPLSGLTQHGDRRGVESPFSIDMDKWLRKRAKMLRESADKEADSDAARMLRAEARIMYASSLLGIDLVGTRDVVEEVSPPSQDRPGTIGLHRIRDTKSTGKSPNKMACHNSEQMDVYSLASLIFDKQLPESVVLDYLVQTKKRHDLKYVPLSSTRTMDDINVILFRFARAVNRWHTACKTGDFAPASPNDWWCSEKFCAYSDRCPAFKKPKLFQIGAAPE